MTEVIRVGDNTFSGLSLRMAEQIARDAWEAGTPIEQVSGPVAVPLGDRWRPNIGFGGVLVLVPADRLSLPKGTAWALQILGQLVATHLGAPKFLQIGHALRQLREHVGLSREQSALSLNLLPGAILLWEQEDKTPSYKQLLGLGTLLEVIAPEEADTPHSPFVQLVPNITKELLEFLRQDPTRMGRLSPEQFEQLVADRLDKMGFGVTRTSSIYSSDGGIDLIAVKRDPEFGDYAIAGQVKHHKGSQKTGAPVVRDLLSLKGSVFRFGLLVTNTSFTSTARWASRQGDNKSFARLRDFHDMQRWLEDNFVGETDAALLPEEIELRPGLRVKLPAPKLVS